MHGSGKVFLLSFFFLFVSVCVVRRGREVEKFIIVMGLHEKQLQSQGHTSSRTKLSAAVLRG